MIVIIYLYGFSHIIWHKTPAGGFYEWVDYIKTKSNLLKWQFDKKKNISCYLEKINILLIYRKPLHREYKTNNENILNNSKENYIEQEKEVEFLRFNSFYLILSVEIEYFS